MQLPFLKTKDKQKNFFLSLLIKPYKVGAILFEEINGKLFILSTNETATEKQTNELADEELLHTADKVISFVEGSLPRDASVEKAIFSVPYDFVEEGKIKKDYLLKLKKVCDGLGLVPMGYLVSIEAIVSSLEKSEGAPVSALFVEVAESKIFAYVVRNGKIIEVASVTVEKSVLESTVSLLKGFKSIDVLPSKIILLDYQEAEGVQQEFLSYQWTPEIPFLHLPQVMVLERGFENEATINGVASQMELEVLQELRGEQKETPPEDLISEVDAKEFGFIKEKDIAKGSENSEDSDDQGVGKSESQKGTEESEGDSKEVESTIEAGEAEPEVKYFKKTDLLSILKSLKLPRFKHFFSLVPPFTSNPPKIKVIILAVFLLVVTFLFYLLYYNFILRSEITIFADKKSVEKTTDVKFEANATSELSVKLALLTEKIKGEDSKSSTGKKETGEKAKGAVTIYSSLSREQTFSKGTAITSATTKREFTLNENVKVASSSGVTDVKTVKAQVTASEIGKEFNLPSGAKFTVGTFDSSEVEAKNDSAFSGGTKKETTVVSQDDLDELAQSLIEKLEKDAVSAARGDLKSNEELLGAVLSTEVKEEKYSKKVDEEAENVAIEATVEYVFGKYKKEDLRKITELAAKEEVPKTYVLSDSESKVDITNIKIDQKNKGASATLSVNAVYIPRIEKEKLRGTLAGKSVPAAQEEIRQIPGVTDVLINVKNKLPLFPKNLPSRSQSILIEIKN